MTWITSRLKTEFSLVALVIHSGADPGPHFLERHPGQHRSPLFQAVFKDYPQAVHCGQVCNVSHEKVELALFLLDENIELRPVAAKEGEKG